MMPHRILSTFKAFFKILLLCVFFCSCYFTSVIKSTEYTINIKPGVDTGFVQRAKLTQLRGHFLFRYADLGFQGGGAGR